ncbi:hypothetical protein LRY60_03570 [Candidatus Woesebacteria bacterium]|nr:hypothetical protein [Candidatus Woesebacteria bacterium]
MKKLGFSELMIQLGEALVDQDFIGEYFKNPGEHTAEKTAQGIFEKAKSYKFGSENVL